MKNILYILLFLLVLLIYYHSQFIPQTTHYKLHIIKPIKKPIKILQISDLHNNCFGLKQKRLLDTVNKLEPDLIVLTGDMVNKGKFHKSLYLAKRVAQKYPTYLITGNHEHYMDEKDRNLMLKKFERSGIDVLDNGMRILLEPGVVLIGLSGDKETLNDATEVLKMPKLMVDPDSYQILLVHEPQNFTKYIDANEDIDLVLSGHAHGGQWNIPIINQGIYAPRQGLFPKYTRGIHKYKNSRLIISRGLGTTTPVPRLFNRPEIVVIEIQN